MSNLILPQRPPQIDLEAHWFDLYNHTPANGVIPSSVGDTSRLPNPGRGYLFNGVDALLRFTDLTGITITSFQGTTTPTINGNDIEFTAGILFELELSNGAFFNCEDTGLIAFNSAFVGFNANKVNTDVLNANTFSYEGDDVPTSYQDEVGYSDGDGSDNNGLYIPRDESNPTLDVLGNPLQYKGKVSYPAKLVESNCLSFDGVDDFLDIPTSATTLSPFTITFFTKIKATRDNDLDFIVGNRINAQSRISIIIESDNTFNFYLLDSNNKLIRGFVNDIITADYAEYIDKWIPVIYINDGLGNANSITLHIFDQIFTSDILDTGFSDDPLNRFTFNETVGRNSSFPLLNIQSYSRVLDSYEIEKIKSYKSLSNSEFIIPCAEGNGTTVYDTSGNDNHGTLVNGVSWIQENDVYHYNYENGYSLYQHNTDTVANPDIRVPLGIDPTITDYTKIKDAPPSLRNHNGAETKVDFNPYDAPALSELGVEEVRDNSNALLYLSGESKGGETLFYNKLDSITTQNRILNYLKQKFEVVGTPAIWYDFDDISTLTLSANQVNFVDSKGSIPNMTLTRQNGTNELIEENGRTKLNTLTGLDFSALASNKADYTFLHDLNLNNTVFVVFTTKVLDDLITVISTCVASTAEIGYTFQDESRSSQNANKRSRLVIVKGVSGDVSFLESFTDNSINSNTLNLYSSLKNVGNIDLKLNNILNSYTINEGTTSVSSRVFAIGIGGGGGNFKGEMAEVIIYDRALSLTEKQQVENYLTIKWQL